jgi:hypothetical protein
MWTGRGAAADLVDVAGDQVEVEVEVEVERA